MTMRVLRARELADGSTALVVHLDDTQIVNGQPDPAWVLRLTFEPPHVGWAQADYRQFVRREARQRCQEELVRRERALNQGGNAIPGLTEGQPLP